MTSNCARLRIGLLQSSQDGSEAEIKVVLQELQHRRTFCSTKCREAGLTAFLVRIVLLECQRQGEWRADWHRYIFALPNDTNTISWLTEQIESHSLFVSLTPCPCLSVSLSCTHFITLSSHRLSHAHSYATVTLMCYTHPSGCCLIAFGSAVCGC